MRARARLVTALFVFGLSLGCGSDHPPAPPPTGGGDTGGGGGGGGGDGGGTAGGSGGGDQGGGSGTTGGSDGGTAGGGAAGGGSGGGTAGPVASADGSVTIERLDGDPECDPLIPASASNAVTLRVVSNSCGGGTSDGGGHVAVAGLVGQGFVRFQVFASGGAPEGTFATSFEGASEPLFPQAEGFQGHQVTDRGRSSAQVDVLTFLGDGAARRTERATPPPSQRLTAGWLQAADPQGGTALVHFGPVAGGGACSGIVSRYDGTGAPRGTGTYGVGGDCRAAAAAVSARGEALVVEDRAGQAWLWWIPAGGGLATPPAPAGPLASLFSKGPTVHLVPLLDGSIAAREGADWTRRFPYLGDHAEDAPGWLTSRPGFTLRNTRGARGYALLPPIDQLAADCSQRIELLAPSGRLCGTVTLKGDGGACTTAAVDQGWDGTVVQRASRDGCAWRAWPKLLAGD